VHAPRNRRPDRAQPDDQDGRAGEHAVGGRRADDVLRPLAPGLIPDRDVQVTEQRERHRDHVLGDRVGGEAPRVRERHRAVDHRRKQHRSDAGRRAVDPPQPRRGRQVFGADLRRKCDLGVADHSERCLVVRGVAELVCRELAAERLHVLHRDVPHHERAVDGDEDDHARNSPLRPPRFSTRRMSPITMALSTALTMS
jgi:hypothetical protein